MVLLENDFPIFLVMSEDEGVFRQWWRFLAFALTFWCDGIGIIGPYGTSGPAWKALPICAMG